jgi:RNA polymerase sigma-70 factor (ECF subfamily)
MLELTTPPVPDADLLVRSILGDRHAFGVLFDRHSRAVFAAAILILKSAADAEEVMSDSFVLLWRKRDSVRLVEGSVLPWLITTARYKALNRRRATRRDIPLNDELDAHASAAADVTSAEHHLSNQLDAAIGQLGRLDQQIILLCLVDEISYEDAAQRLGLTHATVRNRLHRARKQLRIQLERHTDDTND